MVGLAACTGQIADPDPGTAAPSGGAGGRAVDPGGPNPTPFECLATTEGLAGPRLVKLTNPQFRATAAVLLSGRRTLTEAPPIEIASPFQEANLGRFSTFSLRGLSSTEVSSLFDVTHELSRQIVAAYKTRPGNCVSATTAFLPACAQALLDEYGPLAFQRPLTAEESALYQQKLATTGTKFARDDLAALTVQTLLMSPLATFRAELGDDAPGADGLVRLSSYEIAAALSYSLTGYPPDQALWQAARAGELATADQVRAQAIRLIDAGAAPSVVRFVREYLRYDGVLGVNKGVPEHDPAALLADTNQVVADVVAANLSSAFFASLLTTRRGRADALTYRSYGLATAPPGGRPGAAIAPAITLPENERAGILTQPAWLAAFSDMHQNLPVRRGKFIRQSILCDGVPELPIDVIPPLSDAPTLRQRMEAHNQGGCVGCHTLLDPLGFPFEQYDHLGRYRTTENGVAVDASGAIAGTADADGPVAGPIDMMDRLSRSLTVRQCMARHSFRYWMAREEALGDGCALRAADDAYQAGGGSYADFLASLFSSRSFLYRRATP